MKRYAKALGICFLFCHMAVSMRGQNFFSLDSVGEVSTYSTLQFVPFAGLLYFNPVTFGQFGTQLWATDGSNPGTKMVTHISGFSSLNPTGLIVFNNRLYFAGTDDLHGTELWSTDGTEAGTHLVMDVRPGPGSSFPLYLTASSGKLYFIASDSVHGGELWVTDGVTSTLVKDINPGPGRSGITEMTSYNGRLIINPDDGTHGAQLWQSDGTDSGTHIITLINSLFGANPDAFIVYDNNLYFTADDGPHGTELWRSDGTAAGTAMVKDINTNDGSYPYYFCVYHDTLYFQADDGVHGSELWCSNGTASGTTLSVDVAPGSARSDPAFITTYNDKLYFEAYNAVNGGQLWSCDGTVASLSELTNMSYGGSSNAPYYTTYHSKMYFEGADSDGIALFVTDGSIPGTHKVSPSADRYYSPLANTYGLTLWNDAIFFKANYSDFGNKVWVYNDNPTGISTIHSGDGVHIYPNPTTGILNISIPVLNGNANVGIYDLAGNQMMKQGMPTSDTQLNLRRYPIGTYLYRITDNNGERLFSGRIVLE